MMQAACAWAGLALSPPEIGRHTREVTEMIAAAGSIGPRNWRAQLLRLRSERWVRALVRRARAGVLQVAAGSPVDLIASCRDQDGRLLDVTSAGVELLNLIRPTVAIAYYIVFAALALHRHPQHGAKIRAGDQRFLDAFVLEVRRHAPFFPLIGGRAKAAFDHWGHHFAAGDWVVLDLYGTDHDARVWPDPDAFRPQRFLERTPDPFDMVPQGGGDYETTHRCPGEWATEAVLKAAAHRLATMSYDVPPQDLAVDLSRMPTLPRSGFIVRMN
jgi:fatty-acid peroxygenase